MPYIKPLLAIRPVDNHSNHTAKVVFREVLEERSGIHKEEEMDEEVLVEEEEVATVQSEVTAPVEVDDITMWTDYDNGFDNSFDHDLEPDLEEFGTPDQGLVVRRAVPRSPPVSLSCSQPKNMGPILKPVPRPRTKAPMKILPPLPVVPLCPYELIRASNIAEFNQKMLAWEQSWEEEQLWEGEGTEHDTVMS